MPGIQHYLLKFKPYYRFIEWTKTAVFPVFSPLPIYTIGSFFFQEIGRDSLVNKASALAYNFLLAVFPGIIFLFTLIPYIPVEGFQEKLLALIEMVLPSNAYLAVQSTLEDIIKKQNGGLLSFGFFAALFFATNGVTNLMAAFNKSSLQMETRGWIKQRMVAITLTFVIVLGLVLGLSVITAGEYIIAKVQSRLSFEGTDWIWVYVIAGTRWLILMIVYFLTISVIYRYAPANPKKWKLFSPGAWLATLLTILISWGFTYYINNFGNYNKVYGSIGTLIVIMIWMFLNSLVILIGFELNASIDLSKRSIKIVRPHFNTFKDEETAVHIHKKTPPNYPKRPRT